MGIINNVMQEGPEDKPINQGWAGVGPAPAPVAMSAAKDIAGNTLPKTVLDKQGNYAAGGSAYQAEVDQEQQMRDRVAKMQAQAKDINWDGPIVTNPGGVIGMTGLTWDQIHDQTKAAQAPTATPAPATGGSSGSGPFAGVQGPGTTPPAPAAGGSSGGLVAGAMGGSYNPSGAQPQTAATTTWGVTADQLVADRVAKIAAEDSPLIQQARSRALQLANARGMINGSMAAGAAENAVLSAATDIAKQDANTSAQAAQFNTDSANKSSMFNAGQVNQWNSNVLDKNWTTSEREAQNAVNAAEKQKDREAAVAQYKFDAQTQKELKGLSVQYQQQLNNDQAVNDQFLRYMDGISQIDADPNLDADAKSLLKAQRKTAFEGFAKMRGLNLDLSFAPSDTTTP